MAKNSLPASDQKTYLSLHNRFFDLPTITPKYKAFEVISDARLNAAQLMPGRMQPKAHFMDAVLTIGHTHNFFNLSFHYTIRVSSFEGYVQEFLHHSYSIFFYPIFRLFLWMAQWSYPSHAFKMPFGRKQHSFKITFKNF